MRPRNEKGMGLIEVIFAMAITLVLLAALIPNVVRSAQINNANGAAQTLNAIGQAEFLYSSAYGAYVAPSALVGNLAATGLQPCQNPFGLLMGQQSTAPRGYTMTFTPGGLQAGFTCAGVTGYSSFTINIDPADKLEASRHFFFSSTDQKIRFNDVQVASITDPQFTLSANLVGGSSGNGNNNAVGGGGQGLVTTWNSTTTYAAGAEVLRPASINGDSCTPVTSNNYVGIFINLSGTQGDPCRNSSAWFYTGGTAPSWSAAPSQGMSWTLSGNSAIAPPNDQVSALVSVPNSVPSRSSFANFSVSIGSVVPVGQLITVVLLNDCASGCNGGTNTNLNFYCDFWGQSGQTPRTTCAVNTNNDSSGPSWTGCSATNGWSGTNPFVVNPGDQLYVAYYCNTSSSPINLGTVTVTLNP